MIVLRKFLLLFIASISIGFNVLGQTTEKADQKLVNDSLVNEENTYAFVEKMPEFVGGKDSLKAYLKRAVGKLVLNSKNKLKGRVKVSFIVTRSGDVYRPRVMNGTSKELNEAAIQIVSSMPPWKPGKQNGEPLNVILQLPIDF